MTELNATRDRSLRAPPNAFDAPSGAGYTARPGGAGRCLLRRRRWAHGIPHRRRRAEEGALPRPGHRGAQDDDAHPRQRAGQRHQDGRHRHRLRPRHRHRERAPGRGHQARRRHPLAKYVFDIVQNLPDAAGHAARSSPNNYVEISSGAAHFKIVGMAARGVPQAAQGGERAAGEGDRRHRCWR